MGPSPASSNDDIKLHIRITLSMDMKDSKKAESMLNSLLPDNVGIPDNIMIDLKTDGNLLLLEFVCLCDGGSVTTLASTVDEVLEHIGIMNRVLRGI
jgi:hypothetical protein